MIETNSMFVLLEQLYSAAGASVPSMIIQLLNNNNDDSSLSSVCHAVKWIFLLFQLCTVAKSVVVGFLWEYDTRTRVIVAVITINIQLAIEKWMDSLYENVEWVKPYVWYVRSRERKAIQKLIFYQQPKKRNPEKNDSHYPILDGGEGCVTMREETFAVVVEFYSYSYSCTLVRWVEEQNLKPSPSKHWTITAVANTGSNRNQSKKKKRRRKKKKNMVNSIWTNHFVRSFFLFVCSCVCRNIKISRWKKENVHLGEWSCKNSHFKVIQIFLLRSPFHAHTFWLVARLLDGLEMIRMFQLNSRFPVC